MDTWGQTVVPALPAGVHYVDVASCHDHTLARLSDGSVAAWGRNTFGECEVPALPAGLAYVGIAAGRFHSLALRSDGTVVAWGHNGFGQCVVPGLPPSMKYKAVSSGWDFSLALRSDGWVVGWGDASQGQLKTPALPLGLTYVEVSGGDSHVVARRSDGVVVAWGRRRVGQCEPPALPSGLVFTEFAAGYWDTVASYGPAPSMPTVYCTAKINSHGCTPAISVVGIPSASFGTGCTLLTAQLIAQQVGLYFHSTSGSQAVPFHGGVLCVQLPKKRHPASGTGDLGGACGGLLSEDLNVYIASGADPALVPGATAWIQAWSRDPGDPFGDSLSDAVQLFVNP
jgi:hypothetical protein